MKKLLLFICTLLMSVSGTRADDSWTSGFDDTSGSTGYLSDIMCFELSTPDVNFLQFSSFMLEHDAATNLGNFGGDTHLMISSFRITTAPTSNVISNIPASYFDGISDNCPTSKTQFTYTFSKPVILIGNKTYYIYFGKDNGNGTYNIVPQGIKVRTGLSNTGFVIYDKNNNVVNTSSSYNWLPNWAANYSTPAKYTWTNIKPEEGGDSQQDKLTSGGKITIGAMDLYNTPSVTGTNYTLHLRQMKIFMRPKNDQPNSTFGYLLISSSKATSTTNVSAESFVAISNNMPDEVSVPNNNINSSGRLFTYFFDANAILQPNTKYYAYMGTKNQDGTYNLIKYGIRINHQMTSDNGWSYAPEVSDEINRVGKTNEKYWETCYYMFFEEYYPVSYTCKNMAGYTISATTSTTTNPYFTPPSISGYTIDRVMDGENEFDYSVTPITTSGKSLDVYYHLTSNPVIPSTTDNPVYHRIIMDRANSSNNMPYYAEEGGAVKINNVSKSTDQTKWFFVGNETDGYKLYNKRFGEDRVAQVASADNNVAITMVDASSNDGTLFDIRYVSNAYRLYLKGTEYCTNRLSSTTLVAGVHRNINAGSQTTFVLDNVITAYSDIKKDKIYTIQSKQRGYLFGSSENGNVQNNSNEGTMPTNADKWAFIQSKNGRYYLYNVGFNQFFNNASLATGATEYVDFVECSNESWQTSAPVQIKLIGFDASTYENIADKYINMQGDGIGSGNVDIVFDNSNTVDAGNLLEIKEAGSFSSENQASAELQLRLAQGGYLVEDATSLATALAGAPSKIFRIKGPSGYLMSNSDKTYLTNTGKQSVEPDASDTKQQWVLLQNGGKTYLYNIYAEKFVGNDSENADQYTLTDVNGKKALAFGYTEKGSSSHYAHVLTFPVTLAIGTSTLNLNNNDSFTYGTTNYNHPEDKNNMFRFEILETSLTDAQVKDIEIPFNFYSLYDEVLKPFVDDVSNEYYHIATEANKNRVLNAGQYSDNAEHSYYTYEDIVAMNTMLEAVLKQPLWTLSYRIKNNNTGNYVAFGTPTGKNSGLVAKASAGTDDLTGAINLIPVILGKTWKMYMPSQGKYVGKQKTANQPFPLTENEEDAAVMSIAVVSPGVINIVSYESDSENGGVNNGYLHEATDGWDLHGVVNFNDGSKSRWTIEEANDYVTMISPAAVSDGEDVFMTFGNNTGVALCPTGTVKVYQAYAAGESTVRLSEVESKEIPAGAGVVLCAEKGTKQFFTILSSTSETLDRNELVKGDGSTNVTSAYMLAYSNTDTDAKFYKLSDSGYVVPANKAYLPNTSGVRMLSLSFDETTGLENVEVVDTLEGTAYDLQGRRVQKVQKGLYIVNGKKIFVK